MARASRAARITSGQAPGTGQIGQAGWHPAMRLWARSEWPRSVNAGAVFDGYDNDLALVIADTVGHAVIATASAMKPLEA